MEEFISGRLGVHQIPAKRLIKGFCIFYCVLEWFFFFWLARQFDVLIQKAFSSVGQVIVRCPSTTLLIMIRGHLRNSMIHAMRTMRCTNSTERISVESESFWSSHVVDQEDAACTTDIPHPGESQGQWPVLFPQTWRSVGVVTGSSPLLQLPESLYKTPIGSNFHSVADPSKDSRIMESFKVVVEKRFPCRWCEKVRSFGGVYPDERKWIIFAIGIICDLRCCTAVSCFIASTLTVYLITHL